MNGVVTITIAGLIAGVLITITAPPMAAVIMVLGVGAFVRLGLCRTTERRLSGRAKGFSANCYGECENMSSPLTVKRNDYHARPKRSDVYTPVGVASFLFDTLRFAGAAHWPARHSFSPSLTQQLGPAA